MVGSYINEEGFFSVYYIYFKSVLELLSFTQKNQLYLLFWQGVFQVHLDSSMPILGTSNLGTQIRYAWEKRICESKQIFHVSPFLF